jgi:hypothetical protein
MFIIFACGPLEQFFENLLLLKKIGNVAPASASIDAHCHFIT